MTIRRTAALIAVLACGSAVLLLSVASASSTAVKQRISISGSVNFGTGAVSWQLIPLSPGPLKRDSGSAQGSPSRGAKKLLNGQTVIQVSNSEVNTGRHGTFVLARKLVNTEVGSRYSADVGTWRFSKGTGQYKGFTGGGRLAGVVLPSGIDLFNHEGYVTIG
jgi:hypothetical protein